MPYDSDCHHRRSVRLRGYDYTRPGAYFVTICTYGRRPVLGGMVGRALARSPLGEIVAACWAALPAQHSHVSTDAFAVMPDHVHGILVLAEGVGQSPARQGAPVGTAPGSLPAIVQNFKSVSARRCNQAGAPLWQRSYYEHIIRTAAELVAVRRYIQANAAIHAARQPLDGASL